MTTRLDVDDQAMHKSKGRALMKATLVALLVSAMHSQTAAAETLYQADGDSQWRNTRGGMLAQGFQSSSSSPWLSEVTVKIRNQDDRGGTNSSGNYRISLWQGAAGRPGSKLENLTSWQSLDAGTELSETIDVAIELESGIEHFIVLEGSGTIAWDCTFDTPQPAGGPLNTRESSDGFTWDDLQEGTCLGAYFSLTVEAASSEPASSTPPPGSGSGSGTDSGTGSGTGSGSDAGSEAGSDAGSGPTGGSAGAGGGEEETKPETKPGAKPETKPVKPEPKPVKQEPTGPAQPSKTPANATGQVKPARAGETISVRRFAKLAGTEARSIVTTRSLTPRVCRADRETVRINRAGICRLRIVFDKGPVRRHTTLAVVIGK